jgi:hydrogenase nickel incorporation protein HypA/HybF
VHELSLVASLFETLEAQAKSHGAARVTLVKLQIGELAGVVPELLESAFEMYRRGTIADDARLEIELVAVRFRCRACGGEAFLEGAACAACGARDPEIVAGRDLVLERLEVETADA